MVIIGCIIIVVSLLILINNNKKQKRCIKTADGIITGVSSSLFDPGVIFHTYYPTIDFYIGNERITVKLQYGVSYNTYQVGQKVLVHYNPNNPKEFYIDGNKSKKVFGIVCLMVGIALVVSLSMITMVINNR